MRAVLLTLILVELLSAVVYGWQAFNWSTWQTAPSSIFNNSPDASYIYGSLVAWTARFEGMLIGLLAGSVACLVLSRSVPQTFHQPSLVLLHACTVAVPLVSLTTCWLLIGFATR